MTAFLNYSESNLRYFLRKIVGQPEVIEYDFDPMARKLYNINLAMSDSPHGIIVDRTNHIQHPLNISIADKYHWQVQTDTFGEIAIKTAEKIVNDHHGEFLIKWSGGIDSTVALLAMLQVTDRKRITVLCNEASAKEFPALWNHIKNNLSIVDESHPVHFTSDYKILSGDNGDTVWAVIDHSFYNLHSDAFSTPWRDWIRTRPVHDVEFTEEFCSWSGRPINTVLELRAWFYLNCKWQEKTLEGHRDCRSSPTHTICFFNTSDWQSWTMNNLDQIIGNTWNTYKVPAKRFINDLFQDDDYLQNKSKENSISMATRWNMLEPLLHGGPWFAVDQNYEYHTLPAYPLLIVDQFLEWNHQYQLVSHEILNSQ